MVLCSCLGILAKMAFLSDVTCIRLEDGRLFEYLVAHDELMEEKVAFFIRETLEALQHLHTCRVAHLDLKVITCSVG